MSYYIGLDGGSTYLKAALVCERKVVDVMVHHTGIDNDHTARMLTEEMCRRNSVHISMARRIIKMMKKSERGGDILMTGGGALNTGLHQAFEEELMRDVYVASWPQFNGAIGAALIASERGRA